MIAGLRYEPEGPVARACEAATIAVATLDAGRGRHLAPLADFLLRSESVASSKIEQIDAGWRAFGRALAGSKSTPEGRSQLAAVKALISMVDAAGLGPITADGVLTAHRLLMAPDYSAAREAAPFETSRTGSAAATTRRSTRCSCRPRRASCRISSTT